MGKAKSKPPKKELSEGKAIALSVIMLTIGVIAAGYVIKMVLGYFFPGLF